MSESSFTFNGNQQYLGFLADHPPDRARLVGLGDIPRDEFIRLFRQFSVLGVTVEFEYDDPSGDEILERYRGARRLGEEDMRRFAQTRPLQHTLEPKSVTSAWHGLLSTHANICKLRSTDDVRAVAIPAGRKRMLNTEQKVFMRDLPLTFVSAKTGERSTTGAAAKLIVPSLQHTLGMLEERPDRDVFLQRIADKSFSFLQDFAAYYCQPPDNET